MKTSFNYINRCIKRGSRQLKRTIKFHRMRVPRNIPEVVVALTYSQIYDDYSKTNPADFLRGIPTIYALQYILQLECDVHYTLHNPDEDKKHLYTFSGLCDGKENLRLQSCFRKHGENLLLINPEGTMRFVRLALSCYIPEDKSFFGLSQENIKNIFKAYLYCNQLWTNEQINNRSYAFQNVVDASLRIDLPFSEFKYFKDFRTQMYKSIRFFQHAEKEPTLSVILKHFCKERNVKDWKEYIRILFGFFQASMNTPIVNMATAPKQVVDFMMPFIFEPSMLPLKDNLSGHLPDMLRNKFLLRANENSIFLVLSSDLLVDKIYQGLKFDFAKIAGDKHIVGSSGKELTQASINSMLGADFSEHQILYAVMDLIYSEDDVYFRCSGNDTKNFFSVKDGQSEPDYYLRKGNKLMFIENKDVLFPKEIKFSRHLPSIKQSISYKIALFGKYPNPNKLDNKGNPKVVERKEGLGQLFYNIYRLACKPELYRAFDSEVDNVDMIYPVVVTYDNAYSALGVNAYACKKVSGIRKRIRKRFLKMYGIEPDLSSYNIQKPVVVDMDTLIMYSLKLKRKELELFDLIDEYNRLVDEYDNNLSSFSTFMTDYHKLPAQGEDFIKLLYGDILEN